MKRRAFIAGLGSAAWPFAAHAQQRERIRRIGCLSPAAQHNHVDDALEDGLRLLGWTSDQTIKIEYRYTRGREDRVAPIVKEIVGLNFDLIVSWGPPLTRAVKQAAPATDVVFLNGYDAVEEGLVTNLAHPGGYVTGVSGFPSSQLVAKRLQILKDTIPALMRVAVLFSTEQTYKGKLKDALTASARELNVTLDEIEVETPSALDAPVHAAKDRGAKQFMFGQAGSCLPLRSKSAKPRMRTTCHLFIPTERAHLRVVCLLTVQILEI